MSNVSKFKEAADVLQQVDVSEIFTSLALGIAEAQEKLDDNSIRQLLRLSEQEIAGKSLLELGFMPAFYAFSYADVSASIQLKMAMKESLEVGGSLSFDLNNEKGYSTDFLKNMQESQTSKERTEYKSSRDFALSVSETNSLIVENQTVNINHQEGAITKIESFTDKIRETENISRVDRNIQESKLEIIEEENLVLRNYGGYLSVYIPNKTIDKGILKMNAGAYKASSQHEVTIKDGVNFKIKQNFNDTFNAAKSKIGAGSLFGITQNGFVQTVSGNIVTKKYEFYFPHSSSKFNLSYKEVSSSDSNEYTNVGWKQPLELLADLLKADTSINIKILGHTDNTGPEEPNSTFQGNKKLGKARADEMKAHLVAMGVNTGQISTETRSEDEHNASNPGRDVRDVKFRKAEIVFTNLPDYLFFEGGEFTVDADPAKSPLPYPFDASKDHGFIMKHKGAAIPAGDYKLRFRYYGVEYNFNGKNSYQEIIQSLNSEEYSHELYNEKLYLLHNETKIQYTLYSKDQSDIKITEQKNMSSNTEEKESTVIITETVNSKSLAQNDVSKTSGSNTMALGVTLDARYSRQFEFSMEGNSSMSARLISVPPPQKFEQHIMNAFSQE